MLWVLIAQSVSTPEHEDLQTAELHPALWQSLQMIDGPEMDIAYSVTGFCVAQCTPAVMVTKMVWVVHVVVLAGCAARRRII